MRFKRKIRLIPALKELWAARELVRTLAERDLRARYKQAALGFGWAVLTPVILMIVFTLLVRRVGNIDTHGVPYPLFAYVGLLPWTFFSSSVNQGGQSLVSSSSLLNKVYCPREVFPLSNMITAAVDTVISATVLVLLFVLTGYAPRASSIWIPVLLAIQIMFTVGVVLVISAVLVYLRDLKHALPIILQVGLFATPVAWGIEVVPPSFRGVYAALNPLAPVIDGYRRAILYGEAPVADLLVIAAFVATLALIGGYALFKRLETRFADVA